MSKAFDSPPLPVDVGSGADALSVSVGSNKPHVLLPGGKQTITETASTLGKLLAATGRYFIRGGAVTLLNESGDGAELQILKPAAACAVFEEVATLFHAKIDKDKKLEIRHSICSEGAAKLIISASAFVSSLPRIRVLSPCPVLVECKGELKQIIGFDPVTGVLARGEAAEDDMALDTARELLRGTVADFDFVSPSDRARALAGLICPALIRGGLLGKNHRAPVDLGEADDSQAGKGYRVKITCAIYNSTPRTIVQRNGGVGGVDESVSSALVAGHDFISLDNIRGRLDSQAFESLLTEPTYAARVPYAGEVEIDVQPVTFFLTSNAADLTRDMANRCSATCIRKRPSGYKFAVHSEGSILEHIQANQSDYLGAVFAIIREWWNRGKLRSPAESVDHDFRQWARVLDWISRNLLNAGPLLDGHREVQQRTATPALGWLRQVALLVKNAGRMESELRAFEFLDLLAEHGGDIPGWDGHADLESEPTRKSVLQAIGRNMAQCFRSSETLTLDGFNIQRHESFDESLRKNVKTYTFCPFAPNAPDAPELP
ncbi:MAG: hypothetical protein HZC54_24770 [Verrucomicrobia bacterium]|nr:hypothetical protein [Verrucomicrobiota bacterium]